jgi:phosphatidylserine synthase
MYFHEWGYLGVALSFLPVCCAGIRLARFNEDADTDRPVTHFVGLPTTISALVLAGFVIFAQNVPHEIATFQAALLVVMNALLMISHVQYEKSNILSLRYIRKTRRILTGLLILLSLIFFPTIAFFAWGLLYILYGLTRSAIQTILAWGDSDDDDELDEPEEEMMEQAIV